MNDTASLARTAPAFITTAHRIVWATVATVDATGQPRTRILHPIWEWDGGELTGWIATNPDSPKAAHLAHEPRVSITYWDPMHDVATTDCVAVWENDPQARQRGWDRFVNAEEPVGYDPSIVPGWERADSPAFGLLRFEPQRVRVFPGTMLTSGTGDILDWSSAKR